MVLDFAKEAIQNTEKHSINFDELRAGKANIKVVGVGGCGGNAVTWLFNKGINGATIYAENVEIGYYLEDKVDSSWARFRINNSVGNIYMYYGNAGASNRI